MVARRDLQCSGTLGINYYCWYRGLFFAFSAVGVKCGSAYNDFAWHEERFKEMLQNSVIPLFIQTINFCLQDPEKFRVCVWHKNQALMQIRGKDNDTGWNMYNMCAEKGALIVTGTPLVFLEKGKAGGNMAMIVT
jgi:hypothetical protein